MRLTRDDITRVHGILVFNESKAIHELDLGDFARAMGRKVILNISFGR